MTTHNHITTDTNPFPFYRTRLFWGTLLIVHFIINLILLDLISTQSFFVMINNALTAAGSGVIWAMFIYLLGSFSEIHIIKSILYGILLTFLLIKTFKATIVPLVYPSIILISMSLTLLMGIILMGST